jgi:hypothetical protein
LSENEVSYDTEFGYFVIYSSVAIESTDIIRTAGKFHGNEWFSNVVVSSEEAEWYGKVYLNLYKSQILFRYITLLIFKFY